MSSSLGPQSEDYLKDPTSFNERTFTYAVNRKGVQTFVQFPSLFRVHWQRLKDALKQPLPRPEKRGSRLGIAVGQYAKPFPLSSPLPCICDVCSLTFK
jgi:hypothetical protein